MNQQSLQLALITNDESRVAPIEQICASKGWQLVSSTDEAAPLYWLQSQAVHLVLVDLDLPDAVPLLGQINQALPHLLLIALATPQHLVKLQDALLAGATDFVAFPIDSMHFSNTIERSLQSKASMPQQAAHPGHTRGRVIAVSSLKGGVGRSTIAANLAVAMQERLGLDVTLAEAHHGLSNLSFMLNLHPRYTLADLADEPVIDADVLRTLLQTHSSGLRLLSSPIQLHDLVELTGETWQDVMRLLKEMSAVTVVDTTSSPDGVLSEVLMQADDIVIVVGPEIPGLRGALSLLETLRTEPDVKAKIHLVLNRSGIRGGLDETTIFKQLGEKVAVSIPDDSSLATYALNRGLPFVTSHPRAIISRRMNLLADHLQDQNAYMLEAPKQQQYPLLSFLNVLK